MRILAWLSWSLDARSLSLAACPNQKAERSPIDFGASRILAKCDTKSSMATSKAKVQKKKRKKPWAKSLN